jgi:Cu+-exporting ATPase
MVVFDKTGTLTAGRTRTVIERKGLSDRGWALVRQLALESVHPTSRAIAAQVTAPPDPLPRPADVRELAGHGITGTVAGATVAIGSAAFIARCTGRPQGADDRTYVVAGDERGWVRLTAAMRPGIEEAAGELGGQHDISLLSGDHAGESPRWSRLFGHRMRFRQSPEDKLAFVRQAQARGRRVLMVGDGLNDAGALAAADVGLTVSDDTACVVPACDAVISGERLAEIPAFLRYACRARHVVVACFVVSVAYNAVGLTLALAGALTPLASAILMPVSSLTVIGLSSGLMRWSARRMLPV